MDAFEVEDSLLNTLPIHPIFNNNNNNNKNKNKNNNTIKSSFTIINSNQLILSAPPELRLLSLTSFKASSQQSYKLIVPVPASAIPRNPISKLIANPNSRLLAICSSDQVSVISLPRSEEHSDTCTQIQCSTIPIGLDHHLGTIAKLLWHPWSHRASTLLILYSSGFLLEYDVSRDAANPTQILDLNSPNSLQLTPSTRLTTSATSSQLYEGHPSIISSFQKVSLNSQRHSINPHGKNTHKKPGSKLSHSPGASKSLLNSSHSGTYGSTDRASCTAVSICFGTGTADWGPLTLYVVMLNGDLYAICPYLPKNAVIPMSYRNSLLFFLTAKLESISNSGATGATLQDLQGPLNRSLDYLNSLSDLPDLPLDDEYPEESENPPEAIRTHRKDRFEAAVKPLRQGPFLMMPSPIETNDSEEETVSDLLHFRYSSIPSSSSPTATTVATQKQQTGNLLTEVSASSDSQNEGVGVFMIAYQSRVDVCLEVEKIEPRWASCSELEQRSQKERAATELPVLVTYECIDLGLRGGADGLSMVPDARYLDTIYVFHGLGMHAVSTQAWIEGLARGSFRKAGDTSSISQDEKAYLLRAIQERVGSQVAWIMQTVPCGGASRNSLMDSSTLQGPPGIAAVCVVDDAYLGYSLMALTDDGQLVGIPLKHRSLGLPPEDVDSQGGRTMVLGAAGLGSASASASQQLITAPGGILGRSVGACRGVLAENQWGVPGLLAQGAGGGSRRLSGPPEGCGSSASGVLRYANQVWSEIDQYIRQLVEAVNAGQGRLQLQISQFQDQIYQLARFPGHLHALDEHLDAQIARIQAVYHAHKSLLRRADTVLQKLADDRNRDLSREEVRWFAELNRMAAEVREGPPDGADNNTNNNTKKVGLEAQIAQLKSQLEATKARVRMAAERAAPAHDRAGPRGVGVASGSGKMGESQLVPIHHKLQQANGCLAIIHDQIAKINSSLTTM